MGSGLHERAVYLSILNGLKALTVRSQSSLTTVTAVEVTSPLGAAQLLLLNGLRERLQANRSKHSIGRIYVEQCTLAGYPYRYSGTISSLVRYLGHPPPS